MIRQAVAALLSALLLSGCGRGANEPQIERNPGAVDAYRLDFRFEDAPGPFSKVRAVAVYRVENEECVKALPFSGAVLPPEYKLDLSLKPLGQDRYEALFHRDALRDADYFGLGLCRWKLQHVAIFFSSPATAFTAALFNPQDPADRIEPIQSHFLHRDYFNKPQPITLVFGERAGFYPPDQGAQFRIAISAEPR
ncbi:MAG: hypothetical protein O9283_05505 [Sphingomonadaceae bacterium]|nr:hypothetical protein [Sphingomonadaceae bacterium]